MSCNNDEMTGEAFARLGPCERLAIVEAALFELGRGAAVAQVRHGNNWLQYQAGSIGFLERERARLSSLCASARGGGRTGITVTTIDRAQRATPRRFR